jgi:hypothetical protein
MGWDLTLYWLVVEGGRGLTDAQIDIIKSIRRQCLVSSLSLCHHDWF